MDRAKRRHTGHAGSSSGGSDREDLIDRLREANEKLVTANLHAQELAERADAARQRAEFLDRATELLAISLDYDGTLATVARLAVPQFADWCLIDLIEEDETAHRVEVAHTDPARAALAEQIRRFPPRDGCDDPPTRALSSGQLVFIPDVSDEMIAQTAQNSEHINVTRQIGPRSVLAAPLLVRGRTVGVLTFFFTGESARRYRPEDVPLVVELARRCALAVDNARLYRRAEESNRLKDEFLAMLSHELRTPLNAILGWARMLRTGVLPDESHARALETIERNAKAQAQLIDDLLDVSRIVLGKLRLNLQSIDLIAVIGAAVDVVRPAAQSKGVGLEVILEDEMRAPITGDPDRLRQVLWNLLSNAVKFTPKGGRVTVRMQPSEAGIQVSIADTGEGIRAEFLPHVFDPFRQAAGGLVRPHAGLGLGLAIVRQLVELHGGTVAADSPGETRGATFTIRLPVKPLPVPATPPERDLSKLRLDDPAVARLSGVRVLVVEDDADSRDLLAIVLRQDGATVTAVASADEALQALGQRRWDALVADIGLPDQDGYALIRHVRRLEQSEGRRIPAVAVTARASVKDRREAIDAGYDDHVGKPIEPDRVAAVLAAAVRRAASKRNK